MVLSTNSNSYLKWTCKDRHHLQRLKLHFSVQKYHEKISTLNVFFFRIVLFFTLMFCFSLTGHLTSPCDSTGLTHSIGGPCEVWHNSNRISQSHSQPALSLEQNRINNLHFNSSSTVTQARHKLSVCKCEYMHTKYLYTLAWALCFFSVCDFFTFMIYGGVSVFVSDLFVCLSIH